MAARIGKYKILGTLGTGAHSTIFHIRRHDDSKQYALKIVPIHGSGDDKFMQQAQHEFRVAGLLDHPNLIKIYCLETVRDWLFRVRQLHLLIEYVNGQTLDTLRRLRVPQLLQLFSCTAAAMVHMHRRGVYHADLKPHNILLSRAGEVKIIDYGLAWIRGENKNRLQGTPEFMAPEQVKKSQVNEKTDIYNLGATMYRLATWRNPPNALAAKSDLALNAEMWNQLLKPVQDLNPEMPPEFCHLIHRCLAFSPHQRPERMSEVQENLDWLAAKWVKGSEDRLEAFEW
jgi:serine/threonine protein kinase